MRRSFADDASRHRPRRLSGGALAALLVGCALGPLSGLSPARADGDGRPIASPRGDSLGTARLFFTATERALLEGGAEAREQAGGKTSEAASEASPEDADALADAPDGGRSERRADGREPDRAVGGGPTRPTTTLSPRGVFQARVRVGARIRVIVDERPCHGTLTELGTGTDLQCGALPDGLRALALDPDGRRLVATLVDGRRRRLAVGDAALP